MAGASLNDEVTASEARRSVEGDEVDASESGVVEESGAGLFHRSVWDWLAALTLFASASAVVVWQNSRLGVLWDASYILENASRISLGDVPYRDFPFPYAPLTFLTQAAIIKFTGRVFWHHIVYCAVVGGLANVLAYRLASRLLRESVARARLVAFLLCAPLAALGIYCVFPHPFYDPDCTFVILVCFLFLLWVERRGFPALLSFVAGVLVVVPLFVKQNTGLAFLAGMVPALALLLIIEAWRRRSVRGHVLLLAGVVAGLASSLALIQLTAGLDNYVRWTIRFAAERRTPPLADMLQIYGNPLLLLWLAALAVGVVLWWRNRRGRRWLAVSSACLMSLPFVWAAVYLFVDSDTSEQAERLVDVWPFVIVASFVFALLRAHRRRGVARVLPFVIIATVHGAFMSQQLWGSTYGLWPLLILLVAVLLADLAGLPRVEEPCASRVEGSGASAVWLAVPVACVFAASLLVAGGHYVWTHERLDYVELTEGELAHSKQPALRGLSVRGSWLPDFDELFDYTEREIPRDEAILMIPGEDLFYFTTGRRPRFPVLMFDRTVNPYSAEDVLRLARERDVRWLVVKQSLQIDEDQVDSDKDAMVEVLEQDFKQVESLKNYDIYRRKTAQDLEEEKNEDKDEGDDDQDSGDEDSQN